MGEKGLSGAAGDDALDRAFDPAPEIDDATGAEQGAEQGDDQGDDRLWQPEPEAVPAYASDDDVAPQDDDSYADHSIAAGG
ncbi:MAG TPA: hypothetical protein VGB64_00155 [Actinomycetota bacterium]